MPHPPATLARFVVAAATTRPRSLIRLKFLQRLRRMLAPCQGTSNPVSSLGPPRLGTGPYVCAKVGHPTWLFVVRRPGHGTHICFHHFCTSQLLLVHHAVSPASGGGYASLGDEARVVQRACGSEWRRAWLSVATAPSGTQVQLLMFRLAVEMSRRSVLMRPAGCRWRPSRTFRVHRQCIVQSAGDLVEPVADIADRQLRTCSRASGATVSSLHALGNGGMHDGANCWMSSVLNSGVPVKAAM